MINEWWIGNDVKISDNDLICEVPFCLERLRKQTCQERRYFGRNMNLELQEHEAGLLPAQPRHVCVEYKLTSDNEQYLKSHWHMNQPLEERFSNHFGVKLDSLPVYEQVRLGNGGWCWRYNRWISGWGKEEAVRSGTSDEQECVWRIDKIEDIISPMVLKYR